MDVADACRRPTSSSLLSPIASVHCAGQRQVVDGSAQCSLGSTQSKRASAQFCELQAPSHAMQAGSPPRGQPRQCQCRTYTHTHTHTQPPGTAYSNTPEPPGNLYSSGPQKLSSLLYMVWDMRAPPAYALFCPGPSTSVIPCVHLTHPCPPLCPSATQSATLRISCYPAPPPCPPLGASDWLLRTHCRRPAVNRLCRRTISLHPPLRFDRTCATNAQGHEIRLDSP